MPHVQISVKKSGRLCSGKGNLTIQPGKILCKKYIPTATNMQPSPIDLKRKKKKKNEKLKMKKKKKKKNISSILLDSTHYCRLLTSYQ